MTLSGFCCAAAVLGSITIYISVKCYSNFVVFIVIYCFLGKFNCLVIHCVAFIYRIKRTGKLQVAISVVHRVNDRFVSDCNQVIRQKKDILTDTMSDR